jgi:peroxiredoxin|tara:strand:- start:624 stop:1172 length:549 start_codon:yes stop_codon:yes gene_type:complete
MKLSKIIMFALVFSVTTTTYLNAQNQKASQTVQYDFLKGLTKAQVGLDAPDFSAADMNGKTYSLSSLKGKIVVINFWFVECKPCVIEMPELNEILEKYRSEEVVFLAFAMNEKPKIESFLKKPAFDYTILPDSGAVIGNYKIKSYPAHIILDQNSKIAFSTRGLSNSTAPKIDEAIEGLIEK